MQLKFQYKDRKYDLKFNRVPVMQLVGDAASGKSLMCHDIRRLQIEKGKCRDILVIDEESVVQISWWGNSEKALEEFKRYKYVIIDDADIIFNVPMQFVAMAKPDIYWIIIGRNHFVNVPGLFCRCELVNDNNNISVRYIW